MKTAGAKGLRYLLAIRKELVTIATKRVIGFVAYYLLLCITCKALYAPFGWGHSGLMVSLYFRRH